MSENSTPARQGDQAEGIRRLADDRGAQSRRDRIVLVAGAKGGVGATAVALAVARDLAQNAGPTLVTSAVPGRPDLAIMAGQAYDPSERALSQPIDDRLVLYTAPLAKRPAAEPFLAGALGRLPNEGWAVIDSGGAADAWCASLCPHVGRLLLVTTPDSIACLNAYSALKRLARHGALPPVGVVVNHCPEAQTARDVAERIARSTERFLGHQATLAGWLGTVTNDPTRQPLGAAA